MEIAKLSLNTLSPALGSKPSAKRVGRGIGSGLGKTCGKGHKGQKARSGGYHKVGFEGGQMPIQRRLPKFGFTSKAARFIAEIRLNQLEGMPEEVKVISLDILRKYKMIASHIKTVRILAKGELNRAFKIDGLYCTEGAKKIIEAVGGTVEMPKAEAEKS